jgi:DNA-binding IscR family transcriptional regulator
MILIREPSATASIFVWYDFLKSFGYALRGILYVTVLAERKDRIQLDEIAEKLTVPRYFLGKIMNKLAKQGVLASE